MSQAQDNIRQTFARAISRLRLRDPREALLCLPADYTDCRQPRRLLPAEQDVERQLYELTCTGDVWAYEGKERIANLATEGWLFKDRERLRKLSRVEVDLQDARGDVISYAVFGNPWIAKQVAAGKPMAVVGRMRYFGPRRSLTDVELPPAHALGRIWVKYTGIPGAVAGDTVEALVRLQMRIPEAWEACAERLRQELQMADRAALDAVEGGGDFDSFDDVLQALHQPPTVERGREAQTVALRLSALAIQAAALRHNLRSPHPDAAIAVRPQQVLQLAATQRERLTRDQQETALAIVRRLAEDRPLQGLLSGDVGTGKTLTFLLPAVAAHQAGARVAIIAPTDLVADQIAQQILHRFGSVATVERVITGRKLRNPSAILVGSPGLVTVATKAGYAPNFLVCDEQHKLGSEVRERLVTPWTHVLEASATPIPRTLASALYGGMEIFNLRECPVRKTVHSSVYGVAERGRAAGLLRRALAAGEKAAVVYPRIDSEDKDAKTVSSAFEVLDKAFPGQVVMLHGKMSKEEKQAALAQVRTGERPLLVASTVIETGVDIPSVSAMIVRDADKFGISQLHQLRGRLARNGGEAHFAMLVESKEALALGTLDRLECVARTTDGYELAEMDLAQRGFGDLDGVEQSGGCDTVFRLVRLGPQFFLGEATNDLAVEAANRVVLREEERSRSDYAQPRLL